MLVPLSLLTGVGVHALYPDPLFPPNGVDISLGDVTVSLSSSAWLYGRSVFALGGGNDGEGISIMPCGASVGAGGGGGCGGRFLDGRKEERKVLGGVS